ncbi:hypothetical protein Tco_0472003 [Tanacetum coccineum]
MHTARGDGVAGIKRRRRNLSGDGVRKMTTASGRGRLKRGSRIIYVATAEMNPSHSSSFLGTDNQEKDEKQSQNDKTGLVMKSCEDKAKSKPESRKVESQSVNSTNNRSKTVAVIEGIQLDAILNPSDGPESPIVYY